MTQCRICKSNIRPFISFGKQPIANGFLLQKDFDKEYFYDLEVCFCSSCKMVQLADMPDPTQMFHENYAFFSGTSKQMGIHFKNFADTVSQNYLDEPDPFVVEVGSNDGILLKNFAANGVRHLGVEPSANVAAAARKQGVNTLCKFFSEETAKEIVAKNGQADAFLGANVMCHIPDLHSVAKGLNLLLKPRGIVAFEDPYLGDVIEKTSYDQIYDEHVFLFSATSIQNIFSQHGMELIDVIPQKTHGGSMRYVLARKGARPVSPRVNVLIDKETRQGLSKSETYEKFRENCEESKARLVELLTKLKNEKKSVVGYAATSKSTTVLNYCGISPDLLPKIYDTTPIKQGKFSPGTHIPIVSHTDFGNSYPDYALLFGWNHRDEITAKEKEFVDKGGRWLVYVPTVQITK
jgi:methylation protein EvaC